MKSFLFRVVRTVGRLLVACLLIGCLLVGLVLSFAAFFFEQTLSQLTVLIVLQHVCVLLIGLTLVALALLGFDAAIHRWHPTLRPRGRA